MTVERQETFNLGGGEGQLSGLESLCDKDRLVLTTAARLDARGCKPMPRSIAKELGDMGHSIVEYCIGRMQRLGVWPFARITYGIRKKQERLYVIWSQMRSRCNNPNHNRYRNYGGRGISVCDQWAGDFKAFREWALANGYRDDLTFDRIDNNGNYDPNNCTWSTPAQQSRNTTRNRLVTAFGETKFFWAWAEDPRCVVRYITLYMRMFKYDWHSEDAITTPEGEKGDRVKRGRELISSALLVTSYDDEVWKPIPDWIGYEASDLGRVRSYWEKVRESPPRGRSKLVLMPDPVRVLKTSGDGSRLNIPLYARKLSVTLYKPDGTPKKLLVHRLVLSAHVGPPPPGMVACHYPDPDPRNCRLDNLRWDTPSENSKDIKRINTLAAKVSEGNLDSEAGSQG